MRKCKYQNVNKTIDFYSIELYLLLRTLFYDIKFNYKKIDGFVFYYHYNYFGKNLNPPNTSLFYQIIIKFIFTEKNFKELFNQYIRQHQLEKLSSSCFLTTLYDAIKFIADINYKSIFIKIY